MSAQPEPRRLPEANEFSPGQVELGRVLELVAAHTGDRDAIVEAIRAEWFSTSALGRATEAERLKQQRTRANNVLIGMKGYGLFDLKTSTLTPAGDALRKVTDADERAEAFAVHILRDCEGIAVLEAIRSLQKRGDDVTKATLQTELERQGFKLPRATTHHTKVVQWLREASVLDKYTIDEVKVAALLGTTLETLEGWGTLTHEQRAFAETLQRLAATQPGKAFPARDVLSQAKEEHGAIFREDQLAARVYAPLAAQGWIEHDSGKKGRGGKSGDVRATQKLLDLDLGLAPVGNEWGIPPELSAKLDTPLKEVLADIASDDKNVKGVGLELLAVRIATDAGLRPMRFRLRAAETGGAEVDLIAEAVGLHFTRWLFQCKNKARVAVPDIAKEVGMAVLVRASVIVMVTTGEFAKTVRTFAQEIMEAENLQVILIDGKLLRRYRDGGLRALAAFLHLEAHAAMRIKRRQIERPIPTDED